MARILMVVAQEGFRDEELLIPKEIFEKEGYKVAVASLTRAKAKGSLGAVVDPDMAVYEANPDFFEAIVIVGGPGSPKLAESDDVIKLVENAYGMGKVVSAICLGPMTLAAAGVLAEKAATVFPSEQGIRALKDGGAYHKARPVVEDGTIVTADSPKSAAEFANKIVEKLKK